MSTLKRKGVKKYISVSSKTIPRNAKMFSNVSYPNPANQKSLLNTHVVRSKIVKKNKYKVR